jgi:hypothetical protein
MPRWSAGRRSVSVLGALLVLVTAVAVAIYAGLYNIAVTFLTRNPSIGYLKRSETARSKAFRPSLPK